MSECLEYISSMTGSMNSGPLQPQKDSSPLPARSSPYDLYSTPESPLRRGHRQRLSRKMTLTSPNGQPIQLTPLWEHVVRTRKFPSEIDTRLTFLEISERLRDPEWEVRQHALRVLMDVLPTLNADIVDKVMQPVVPELVNNLGHPAPAVRKGALDAFRVFLIHSYDRENTIKNILQDGLNRSEVRDSFQTNVTTGVILSVPSLLFPSSSSPLPNPQLVKDATIALASRLAQVPHQEAVLKSLMKIRDSIGMEEFESYLEDYDNKLKKNIEILSKIYNVRSNKKTPQKVIDTKNVDKLDGKDLEGKWESDSDTSGIVEEEDEISNTIMPAARVVLETEIKFNEETAITMTILEEKEDSEQEQDEEEGETDITNEIEEKEDLDKRKTPRRVHFGGEIVKLRTPDSDDTESVEVTPKTRIPLPVSPVTKMPITRPRPSSQPCSPHRETGKPRMTSRSVSSSPKREVYTYNAELSPKKSILTRTSSPLFSNKTVDQSKKKKNMSKQEEKDTKHNIESSAADKSVKIIEINEKMEEDRKEEVRLIQSAQNIDALGANAKGGNSENLEDKNSLKNRNQEDPLITEPAVSKSGLKIESDNFEIQNKKTIQEVRDKKGNLENKVSENVQKKITVEKIQNPEDNHEIDSLFGSVVKSNEIEHNLLRINQAGAKANENETVQKGSMKLKGGVISSSRNDNGDRDSLKNIDCKRTSRSDHDKGGASVIEKNGNIIYGNNEMESISGEPSWEELGLVSQEVLEDLHNKDDWRARVRGLERVASALRTSSALIAIEPRLGSLLHAALGCERSCRVAAAGLAVAKVVVAGVSEEALKKRLPQLAWGLARHGGPSAAQLARITMLRLRPALLLEQLLQPQCLGARNTKTRENTLQLLIFSLVTFPSTEFEVETVANKVVKMVRDKRRRVRQAALDTLAVLAQIYESQEVLAAGKRASEDHLDGEAMMSAIRARLARKSLPLVSADGLVMYGLQISPTVQIATGPDVNWIVAGSGSISPGIGRNKGQVIATRSEKEKFARNENTNGRENLWGESPNFLALGVGMRSKSEQPIVWQIVPTQNEDIQCEDELNLQHNPNTGIRNGETFNSELRSRNQTKILGTVRESATYRNVIDNNFDSRENNNKTESRIPVLYPRDYIPKSTGHSFLMDRSPNSEIINVNVKRRLRDTAENSEERGSTQQDVRSCGTMYHQRRRNHQENSTSMHYNNYRSVNNNADIDSNCIEENTNKKFSDSSARAYKKFMEKNRYSRKSDVKSKYSRSSSTESHQTALPRNINQQTFVMHNMYNALPHREGHFVDENSFQPLQTSSSSTYTYNKIDFNRTENNDKSISRVRSHRKTKDVAAQKINDVELISSDAQTSEYLPTIYNETPYRRRLRSLSPSQLYHRQQFVITASNEVHALSMYDIDKAVNEEEYNEKNKHHFLPDDTFGEKTDAIEAQYEVEDQEFSSSDVLENNYQEDIEQDVQDTQDDSDSESSTSGRQNVNAAFDIITGQSSPPHQDTVDFIISLDPKGETGMEATSIDDDGSKNSSSEEELKSRQQSRAVSRSSEFVEYLEENQNESEFSTSDENGRTDETSHVQERSVVSVLTTERGLTDENLQTSSDILHSDFPKSAETPFSRGSTSPKKSNQSPSRSSIDLEASKSSRCNSRSSPHKLSFELEDQESADSSEEKTVSPIVHCDSIQSEEPNQSHRESKSDESPAIIIASRPHSSTEVSNYSEKHLETTVQMKENDNTSRFVNEPNRDNNVEDGQSRDSSSETNTEPGILKIETQPVEPLTATKRKPSRVPRVAGRGRSKGNSEKPEKTKPIVQQCFAQLENKDWEIIMKGLKTLSQIAKQQPEYLDGCASATISRLLGRQIKSLRSQVARTACLAASDIFSSQIRGIDQDFDDIVGPLLHRTADTNRFLRADSNAALDRMVEHLPPHKTITVIVQHGASHQNAIVRAATARLLASIVDRIGPEHTLILPKDVKDKLLSTGARLLIDGNLDARNQAKRMFRLLTHCEGFRKALTDAVPETTLRHIDKTLKTL